MNSKSVVAGLALWAGCLAIALGPVAPGAAKEPQAKPPATPPLWNLSLSRSVYTAPAGTVVVGQTLPGGGTAVADGAYPEVFLNAKQDGSFGVTSPCPRPPRSRDPRRGISPEKQGPFGPTGVACGQTTSDTLRRASLRDWR